jgi:uncharacterized protein (TIGR02246 family)
MDIQPRLKLAALGEFGSSELKEVNMTKKYFLSFLALVLSFVVFMPSSAKTNMNTQEADVRSIRELERMAREAAEAKDLDRYVSFYADDAVLFWPGAPMVTGRAAIREFMQVFLSMPAFSLSFETAKVEVSRAGDLAYSYGTNKVTLVDPNGKRMKDRGKYLTVYRKQPDGTWKVVVDIGNSDLPAPIPE